MTNKKIESETHPRGYSVYFSIEEDEELKERVKKTGHKKVSVYIRETLFPPKKEV